MVRTFEHDKKGQIAKYFMNKSHGEDRRIDYFGLIIDLSIICKKSNNKTYEKNSTLIE